LEPLRAQTENALGLRPYCEKNGIELVVTSDKEGPESAFNKHIVDADVLITCVQLSRPGQRSRALT